MKKQLLLVSLGLMSFGMNAQSNLTIENNTIKPFNGFNTNIIKKNVTTNRNATCGPDTALYSLAKELNADPTGNGLGLDIMIGPNRSWSQAYTLSTPATISGITFYGGVYDRANPAQTINAKVYLYTVDATFRPIAKIDSAIIQVTTAIDLYSVNFTNPVAISSNYAVAVQNPVATDTLAVVLNNATTATYGETLGWRRFGSGVWNTAVAYATQDLEAIIAPHIQFNVATDYTVASTPSCIGTTINFTNTTTPTALVENRMYSYYSLLAHFNSVPDSTYFWDMDDASAIIFSKNASHSYATSGTFNPTLYTLTGLYTSCVDTKASAVVIDPNAVASYTADATNAPTVAFTNTSTGGTSYSWDFGDGSPADLTQNPSHTYSANGTYTVVLTVTGPCNTVTSSQTVTISVTGIDTYSQESFSVYPNPSNGLFTVNMNTAAKTIVEVYNVIGEVVFSTQLANNTALVDLSNYSAGVYSMKVISENATIVKQIVLTK
jgi:PKD repeat protein